MKLSSTICLFALVLLASCVKNDVTSITLNKTTSYIIVGQTDSLSATLTASGDIKNIPQTWTTSNSAVVTVQNGVVTGIRSGTAIITVKAGDKTATCEVTVDDKILPIMTQGELWYYGDAYGTTDSIKGTGSNNFILYLASSGIRMDSLTGKGEVLVIELNTSLTVKDSIPVGTYDMMTDLSKAINFASFTLVPGYVDSQTGYTWGCWYFGIVADPISMGNMVVTKLNNIYTINYVFFDNYGVTISGNYRGSLSYVNGTLQAASVSVKNRMKLKSVSMINKAMKFKRR